MFDPTVKQICMPRVDMTTLLNNEWPLPDTNVVAIGWGTLAMSGSLPAALQQVTLQTVAYTDDTCSSVIFNKNKQFCAGVLGGGKDTCQGDSGGPVMMYTNSKQWVLDPQPHHQKFQTQQLPAHHR
ncbi:unnamed protein product [Rotaria sordida]|uniref:Peptidase S1 domain-containing protein n=1 Tax=Rotaria sordida TaxID=392033 RepID=A0A814C5K9_9BILA|nr:unnamed protein product [Rotaria sordida]CAF0960851.1 unnamed protein product [Rotaria sordida]